MEADSEYGKADSEYKIVISTVFSLARRAKEIFDSSEPDEKREIIQLTLQNLSLNDGKLEYTLQKPFDSVFETSKSLKWGGEFEWF